MTTAGCRTRPPLAYAASAVHVAALVRESCSPVRAKLRSVCRLAAVIQASLEMKKRVYLTMSHRRRRMATDPLRHRISLQTEVDFLTKQTVLPMQSPLKRNKNAYLFI